MEHEQSQKKKVLFVITKSNWGGAQRYVYDLVTGLPQESFEVSVLLGGSGALKEKLDKTYVRTISMPEMKRDIALVSDVRIFFKLIKLFRNERPNVVHLNSSKVGGLGALAARIAGVPRIIFTAHGWAFNEERGYWAKSAITFLSWMTVLFSHHTITVSEYDGRQGKRMPLVGGKISVIHNGVSNLKYKSKKSAREELLPVSPDKEVLWVGTIAELHANKGIQYAIKAMAQLIRTPGNKDLPPFLFVIVGEGEERTRLEALVAEETLESYVVFAGHKENAALLLSAFDMFILPSTKEGLPYVLLEAGQAKLPTISTNVGGISEIISDMNSGILVRPKHSRELAEGLSFLLEDKKKRAEFGANLQETIKESFSTEQMIASTQSLYRS